MKNASLGLKSSVSSVVLTGELNSLSLVSAHGGELVGENRNQVCYRGGFIAKNFIH